MTTALLDSEIRYSPDTQDYDILICGQVVASAHNYSLAEAKRTRLLAERRDEGMYASATELDGEPDPNTPELNSAALAQLHERDAFVPDGTDDDDFSDCPAGPGEPERAPRLAVNWNSAPADRLIPVADLHTLAQTDPATFRAKLAALSSADLRTQATLYAIYASMLCDREISAAETLEHFRLSIDMHRATVRSEDAVCLVLYELALTDAPAMIEFLRSHTDAQRAQLAGRFAAWLQETCKITREPSHILKGWQALCAGAAASGLQIELADCLGFASGWDAVAALWRGTDATVESHAAL